MSERPDFSGEWTLNRQASTLSPGADNVQSAVWQIEHREPSFRHKAAFETMGAPRTDHGQDNVWVFERKREVT